MPKTEIKAFNKIGIEDACKISNDICTKRRGGGWDGIIGEILVIVYVV